MRKYLFALLVLVATGTTLLVAAFATAGSGTRKIEAKDGMLGIYEVPAVSTVGNGTFEAKINQDETEVAWTLHYEALEGGTVQQAHIHFGQRDVNGGISVFFCTNIGNAPPAPASPTPACPPPPATISGTFRANDVVGPTGQGIEPGSLAELIAAIRAGKAYANVHTLRWGGGEIRGQLNDPNDK